MLGIQWPSILKGKINIECTGTDMAQFINLAVQAGIQLENIYWVDEQKIHMTVLLPDFFSLVSMLKKNKMKMRIVKKTGFPFFIERMKKQKTFYIGFILFIFLVFIMSSFVWKVDIEGTERIPAEHIRALLEKEGVFVGQLKMKMPDREQIQYRLLSRLPEVTWVGVREEGTRVTVTVVEKTDKVKVKEESPSYGPVHLIASKSALIYDMRVERGNSLVEVNDVVKKGQILVSGRYGDSSTGTIVGAKGKILGEVVYESEVKVPMIQKRKVYTGYRMKKNIPFIGTLLLRFPFGNDLPYKQFETIQKSYPIYFGNWQLPFGWVEEEYLEMEGVNQKLTQQEAFDFAKKQAREEMLYQLGKDGRILEEKVLHQSVENGKVYLKIHFDAVENIAVPQPILQGE